jgi:hypothetical protein
MRFRFASPKLAPVGRQLRVLAERYVTFRGKIKIFTLDVNNAWSYY